MFLLGVRAASIGASFAMIASLLIVLIDSSTTTSACKLLDASSATDVGQLVGCVLTNCLSETSTTVGPTTCKVIPNASSTEQAEADLAIVGIVSDSSTVAVSCSSQLRLTPTSRLLNLCLQNVSYQLNHVASTAIVIDIAIGVALGLDVYKATTLAPASLSDYVSFPFPSSTSAASPLQETIVATTSNATNASSWTIDTTATNISTPSSVVISGGGLWFVSPRWDLNITVGGVSAATATTFHVTTPFLPVAVEGMMMTQIRLPESPFSAAQAGAMHVLLRYGNSSVIDASGGTMAISTVPANGTVLDAAAAKEQPLQLLIAQNVPRLLGGAGSVCSVEVERKVGEATTTSVSRVILDNSTSLAPFSGIVSLGNLTTNPLADVAVVETIVNLTMQCLIPESLSTLLETERLSRSSTTTSGTSLLNNILLWRLALLTTDMAPLAYLILPVPPTPRLPREDILQLDDDSDHDDDTSSPLINDWSVSVFPITLSVTSSALPTSASGVSVSKWLGSRGLAWGLFVMVLPLVIPKEQLIALATKAATGSGNTGYRVYITQQLMDASLSDTSAEAMVLAANITLITESSICSFVQIVTVDSSGVIAGPSAAHQRSDIVCGVYQTSTSGVPLWVYQLVAAILGALLVLVVLDDVISEIRDVKRTARAQQQKDHHQRRRHVVAAAAAEEYVAREADPTSTPQRGRGGEAEGGEGNNNDEGDSGVISSWDDGGIGMLTVMSAATTTTGAEGNTDDLSKRSVQHSLSSPSHHRQQAAHHGGRPPLVPTASSATQQRRGHRIQNDPFYVTTTTTIVPPDLSVIIPVANGPTATANHRRPWGSNAARSQCRDDDHDRRASSSSRQCYTRLCACMAALWDIGAFPVNVVFVVLTLGQHPHKLLRGILVMVGIMIAALICLAIRTHVVLFSMPSRVMIRRSKSNNHQYGALQSSYCARGGGHRKSAKAHQQRNAGEGNKRESDDAEHVLEACFNDTATNTAVSEARLPVQRTTSQHADNMVCSTEWETTRPSHFPLASHFWPGVGLYVLAVDATWMELQFTQHPRAFWFGLQRLVHDAPSLAIALWFTIQYTHSTNAASAAQLFFSGAGIAFGYRGVLTAMAVPVVVLLSRCFARFQTTTLELWLRERTGLLTVGALMASSSSNSNSYQEKKRKEATPRDRHVAGTSGNERPDNRRNELNSASVDKTSRGPSSVVASTLLPASPLLLPAQCDRPSLTPLAAGEPPTKTIPESGMVEDNGGVLPHNQDVVDEVEGTGDAIMSQHREHSGEAGYDDDPTSALIETCGGSAVPLPVGVFVHPHNCNVVSEEWGEPMVTSGDVGGVTL
ncbi:membrane-associated protein, putative [Bodo saltans]|uniref:Membrane-associated protein, putative n=1 Tax=Bodo saltans TaxID=75058 RepID=A0A0S4J3B6_BODSA|nr:membrane-associated protein, putative [Bodo saltans]|eukprot:CUG75153.1 membrane-associated protein, putative [Bodo saltans]